MESKEKLDYSMMIERTYNIISNFEEKINSFFKQYKNIDTKIVEKETAFIDAKQEFKKIIEDYRSTLDKTKEDFNLALTKEQKEFIEVANTNTEKILKTKEEELKQKLEAEENKIILKVKDLLEAMESFQSNINKTLATNIAEYKELTNEEISKYKNTVITEVDTCKDSLKESTEAIKEIAEDIKAENSNIIKNRNNLEADYNKVNSSLNKVSKDTNNLIKSINEIRDTFVINKIYIFLFSLLNALFILRIIVPQRWEFNFYGKKTLWTLIIVASLLIILAIADFIVMTILPMLFNLIPEEKAEED